MIKLREIEQTSTSLTRPHSPKQYADGKDKLHYSTLLLIRSTSRISPHLSTLVLLYAKRIYRSDKIRPSATWPTHILALQTHRIETSFPTLIDYESLILIP